jgi:hypothetical protein
LLVHKEYSTGKDYTVIKVIKTTMMTIIIINIQKQSKQVMNVRLPYCGTNSAN